MAKKRIQRTLFHKIVNSFILLFAGLVFLSIVLLGFSQTKTFREILRENIISYADSTLNGKLSIERIDGSVISSLILRNISIHADNDTLFYSKKIELHLSPHKLLFKKLYARKIIITGTDISLKENNEGSWNIDQIFGPKSKTDSVTIEEPVKIDEDSESPSFPFIIQANALHIRNMNFVRKSYANLDTDSEIDSFDIDNLSVEKLDLDANILANISNSDYRIYIQNLSFNSNFHLFNLNNFECALRVTKNYAEISNLEIQTDSSNLRLGAKLDSLNIFGDVNLEEFENYPLYLELYASPFCFDDLTSFIPSTEILKGKLSLSLEGLGSFGDLSILNMMVNFKETNLELTGEVRNLHKPERLNLDVSFQNSKIDYDNVLSLLPTIGLPEFQDLMLSELNVQYKGTPTNFYTNLDGKINDNIIRLDGSLNLDSELMGYNVKFETEKIDLSPVISFPTSLTTSGFIQGKGVSISDLNSEFEVNVSDSYFDKHIIDSTLFRASANNDIVLVDLKTLLDSASTRLSSKFDFTDVNMPEMELRGHIKNLDLSKLLDDPKLASRMNLNLTANVRGDDINYNSGSINARFYDTQFGQLNFPNLNFTLTSVNNDNGRTIEVLSDLADIKLEGDYLISEVIDVVSFESNEISNIFTGKFIEINPLDTSFSFKKELGEKIRIENEAIKNFNLAYSFTLKENDLLEILLQEDEIALEGSGQGQIRNDSTNFTIDSDIYIDHMFVNNEGEIFYFSDLEANINFTQDNQVKSFNNLFGSVSVNSERIMAGAQIDNLSADFIFNENKFFYNVYSEIDTSLKSSVEGNFTLGNETEQLLVNELFIDYKDIEWVNELPFTIDFFPDSIRINGLNIVRDTTSLSIDGTLSRTETQHLNISLQKLPGNIFGFYVFGFLDNNFSAGTELNAVLKGNLQEPEFNSYFSLNNIRFDRLKLGNIECELNYKNSVSNVSLVFLDTLLNVQKPYITVTGVVPQYLGIDDYYAADSDDQMNIQIKADNFNLLNLGNIVPTVSNQRGIFQSNINISGYLDEPSINGFVQINKGRFRSTLNNLDYLIDIKLLFKESQITIDKLSLANSANAKYKGTITGSGLLDFDFDNPAIELVLAGDLTLLSEQSRSVSPNAYGDLYVASDRPWRYSYNNNRSYFDGDFIIKAADITFIPARSGYTVSDDIIYNIKIDSSKIDRQRIKFEKLAKNIDENLSADQNRLFDNFSFDANLRIENSAKLVFLLSRTLNQRLTVEVEGGLNYSTVDDEPVAQGEFTLLSGSKLDFFKSLDAEGTIRFESDITDPFIDVVATYQADYYYPGTNEAVPTAVKIKIESTAQNLDKYLNESKDNVKVYSGTRNIENNSPDNRYEATDAITFILVGKFPSDLSTGEKSTLTETFALDAAGSVLGNALTSVLNSQVGDLVNDVRFSSSGDQTKVSVSGRIEDFRYSIGGTSSEGKDLSDISFADVDVKIEYPVTSKLMLRLERKNPIIQKTSSSNEQKINEFGLKYLFVF